MREREKREELWQEGAKQWEEEVIKLQEQTKKDTENFMTQVLGVPAEIPLGLRTKNTFSNLVMVIRDFMYKTLEDTADYIIQTIIVFGSGFVDFMDSGPKSKVETIE
jgi:hypothetical protein